MLAENTSDNVPVAKPAKKKGKSIEATYQKKVRLGSFYRCFAVCAHFTIARFVAKRRPADDRHHLFATALIGNAVSRRAQNNTIAPHAMHKYNTSLLHYISLQCMVCVRIRKMVRNKNNAPVKHSSSACSNPTATRHQELNQVRAPHSECVAS
jgi:hypothetical protein